MALTSPGQWVPQGIAGLEDRAEEAVRSIGHTVIIAGPGAGKTELLAQRACYLLQTGLCPAPFRILAISFKRDAARNLRLRVRERCGTELARRFESFTFDAFAKSLLDRFRRGLPQDWAPTPDYHLNFELSNAKKCRDFAVSIVTHVPTVTEADIYGMQDRDLYDEGLLGSLQRLQGAAPAANRDKLALGLWGYLLQTAKPSNLTFPMIGRLVELLVVSNQWVARALRSTYRFVFLDEFQDTTRVQYDLTKAAFLGSQAVLTAVGDNKQRIMGWAGALDDAFGVFASDFNAETIRLLNNYRAAPRLVKILAHINKAVDPQAPDPIATGGGAADDGECRVLEFPSHEVEATHIARLVAKWVHDEGVDPRRICVLTRQLAEKYTERLRDELEALNIQSRVEDRFQDLLTEPLVSLILDLLRLATGVRAPEVRDRLVDYLSADAVDEQAYRRALDSLHSARRSIGQTMEAGTNECRTVLKEAFRFLKLAKLKAEFPQYRDAGFLKDVCSKLLAALDACLQGRSWAQALDKLEGVGVVPIMTMHKSKGLEYHSVVFVGLEDSALWGYRDNPQEETSGFFVAFSRAQQRVLFTYSKQRPGKFTNNQSRHQITSLYDVLQRAGVEPEEIDE